MALVRFNRDGEWQEQIVTVDGPAYGGRYRRSVVPRFGREKREYAPWEGRAVRLDGRR